MGEYLRPDVYVERKASGASPIQALGTSTGAFVGVALRGEVGVPTLVTSWTEYVNSFARGLDSPFVKSSDLAYAVYGFFQNGGGRCYITRVATATAKSATATQEVDGASFTALGEGAWANTKLSLKVTANEDDKSLFDISVIYNDEVVEVFEGLSNDMDSKEYYVEALSKSGYIRAKGGTLAVTEKLAFAGGVEGNTGLNDADYLGEKGLKAFDNVDEINIVAIPGQTSKAVLQGLVDYCSNRKTCFAVLDAPLGLEPDAMITFKKENLSGNYGAVYYPWGKVLDPLSTKGALRLVPPSGHVMGIYARTDVERGVYKAPAGTEATVKGFVELETKLTNGHVDLLNSNRVNCIMARKNQGIVVWGARVLTPHLDRVYVSDMRFDINLETSLYEGTQWTVFEPNNSALWNRITGAVKAFLYNYWADGALFGSTPDEAYFVKCDEELNPQEVRDAGKVICEVGVARNKPAEFVIFRISQKTNGSAS